MLEYEDKFLCQQILTRFLVLSAKLSEIRLTVINKKYLLFSYYPIKATQDMLIPRISGRDFDDSPLFPPFLAAE